MNDWQIALRRGKTRLSKNDPRNALKELNTALENCPAHAGAEMGRILFFLGITLQKLGRPDCAIQSWRSAVRLSKNRYARKMLARFSSEYGLPRHRNSRDDDREAFLAIQLEKYLLPRNALRFGSDAEKDMVVALIQDYWTHLCRTGLLNGKSCREKADLFKSIEIPFPLLRVPQHWGEDPVIEMDFRLNRRLDAASRCPCGSNLPFLQCCGNKNQGVPARNGLK